MSEPLFVVIGMLVVFGVATGTGIVAARRRGQTVDRRVAMGLLGLLALGLAIALVVALLPPAVAAAVGGVALVLGVSFRLYLWRACKGPSQSVVALAVVSAVVATGIVVALAIATKP